MDFSSLSGERVLEERVRLGLNQAVAGEACGVSREMWGRYERGKASMGIEVLSKFALIGADTQYILTGERNAAKTPSAELTGETTEEELLLKFFRALPESQQNQLLADLLLGKAGQKTATGGVVIAAGKRSQAAGRDVINPSKKRKE